MCFFVFLECDNNTDWPSLTPHWHPPALLHNIFNVFCFYLKIVLKGFSSSLTFFSFLWDTLLANNNWTPVASPTTHQPTNGQVVSQYKLDESFAHLMQLNFLHITGTQLVRSNVFSESGETFIIKKTTNWSSSSSVRWGSRIEITIIL